MLKEYFGGQNNFEYSCPHTQAHSARTHTQPQERQVESTSLRASRNMKGISSVDVFFKEVIKCLIISVVLTPWSVICEIISGPRYPCRNKSTTLYRYLNKNYCHEYYFTPKRNKCQESWNNVKFMDILLLLCTNLVEQLNWNTHQ